MKNKNTILVFATLFLLAVLSRWVSHLWNFTLVGGAFIFAASYFSDKKISVVLMLVTMLISDYIIGFHSQMISVYLGYLVMLGFGFMLSPQSNRLRIFGYSFVGTLAFYLITNFSVWLEGQLYPKTLAGLIDCYVMALPFYRNQLLSDVLSAVLFFEAAKQVSLFQLERAKTNK
jgi:hypothetical protein